LENADATPIRTETRGNKLMIGAAFMSAGNIIRFGLQLVMLPIIARMLGPHIYGLASFAMPLISLASLIGDTGLSAAPRCQSRSSPTSSGSRSHPADR
jgi:hypothetical protein